MKKLVIAVGALAALSLACHKEEAEQPATHTAQPAQAPAPNAQMAPSAPTGPSGIIEGEVVFQGKAPEAAKVNTSSDPACANAPQTNQSLVVNSGKVANVLVRVSDADLKVAAPAQPVTIDQKSCNYSPRVQGAVEGQKLEVRNDDPTLHNVHAYVGVTGGRPLFNNAQPPGAAPIAHPVPTQDGVLKVKCDVHPWMEAYVVVNHNPYFGSTGADRARSRSRTCPAGKHTLTAWQEKLGTKTIDVEVKPNQITHVNFTFAGSDHP